MDPKSFQLTLEQKFAFQRMRQEMPNLSPEQVRELLVQASRLLMLKDNTIKSLVREVSSQPLHS